MDLTEIHGISGVEEGDLGHVLAFQAPYLRQPPQTEGLKDCSSPHHLVQQPSIQYATKRLTINIDIVSQKVHLAGNFPPRQFTSDC